MEWLIRISVILAVTFGAIIVLTFVFQRSLLYFPDPTPYTPDMTIAPEMQVVRYATSDGIELTSWYAPAPQYRPTVVLFHGNAGNIAHRAGKARVLIDAGFGVLLAAYRGYGGNAGSPSEDGLLMDGRAALEFFGANGISADRLILMGESLGTGVAVALGSEMASRGHQPAALILEAGYSSMADVAASVYPFLPARLLIRDRFSSIERVSDIHAPLLMVHGTDDEIISRAIGQRLFAAAKDPKELRLIEGAGHNDVWDRGGGRTVLGFLAQMFPLSSTDAAEPASEN